MHRSCYACGCGYLGDYSRCDGIIPCENCGATYLDKTGDEIEEYLTDWDEEEGGDFYYEA